MIPTTIAFTVLTGQSAVRFETHNTATLYSGAGLSYSGNGSDATHAVNGDNLYGSYLLLAAQTSSDFDDEFKVRNLSFNVRPSETPSVPDSGSTLLLLGSAVAGLGMIARRRSRA